MIRTLQNGITSGRIAHSYLFTGPRGTGKTSTARLLAKALCCEKGPTPEPCNVCEICVSITDGSCIDVVEMDAASEAGVEQVRENIVEVAEYLPMVARYKVYIIDEVHDLSPKAFDALLKTIEEPPPHVIFILATTEFNKVPPTIRSRCQKHEFNRGSLQELVMRLTYVADSEGAAVEPAALTAMARMADGGYRDALTILEQALITSEGTITLTHVYDQLGLVPEEVVDNLLIAMKQKEVEKIVELLSEVARRGRDPRSVLESMLHRLSDLTRAAYGVDIAALGDATQEASLHETATRLGKDALLSLRGEISEAHKEIRDISLPRIWLESELIRIALVPTQTQGGMDIQPASGVSKAQRVPSGPAPSTTGFEPVTQGSGAPRSTGFQPVSGSVEPTPAAAGQREAAGHGLEARATGVELPPTVAEETAAPVAVVSTPAAEIEPSGDPELDRIRGIWPAVVEALSKKSPTAAMKLPGTQVSSVAGTTATIAFMHQQFCEWVTESPKRKAMILEEFRLHASAEWELEYTVVHDAPRALQAVQAVELPAEGQKLADMAREVFGPGNNK